MHIRISLWTRFHLKQPILIFWTKFSTKGYFRSKIEKVNITTEFNKFELVYTSNFILIRQCCLSGWNLLKKSRKMPECEILCWLVHEVLCCFTSHYSISPYSVQMRENKDQKISEYGHFSRRVYVIRISWARKKNGGIFPD